MKNCHYCCRDIDSRNLIMERIYINENNFLTDDEEEIPNFKINFCPICGKKLVGKKEDDGLSYLRDCERTGY